MKIKKILALVLAGAMTATMLAGCGDDTASTAPSADSQQASTDESSAPADEGSDAEQPAAPSGEVVTINVTRATFNLGTPDSEQVKKVETAINEYIKDKINVQIVLTEISSNEYTDKANLSLANNEINLLWTAAWEAAIGTNDLVPKNAVYDITDLLQSEDGKALYESMDASQWENTKYNGRNYYIPVYKDNVEGYDLMARKDLVDKYGWDLSSVKSLKDIEPMLEDCKSEGLKYPYLTQKTAMFYRWYINDFDFFTADATANWVAVDKSTNEVVDVVTSPQYLEFCTLMADWADKGYISEDDVTKTTNDQTTQEKTWGFSWWTDVPVNDEASARYGQDVVMQPLTDRWAHSTSALGSCYCVTSNSTEEQAKACLRFMGLLYTDSKLADLYTFGIEGEDYVYATDGGRVLQSWVDDNGTLRAPAENEDPTGTSEKYNHSMWESASATIVTPMDNEPDNKAELYKGFNNDAKTSPATGFHFDKKPVEAEFAACQNIFNEYGYNLENGAYPPADVQSKIDEYQAALDGAGYQKILTEFQNQYNAWKG